jgi:hypothetical protein
MAEDQISHPCKIMGKIIAYFKPQNSLDNRREHNRFWTDRKQVFPELNLLLMSLMFLFVNVVPKYFNIVVSSKNLLYHFRVHVGDEI